MTSNISFQDIHPEDDQSSLSTTKKKREPLSRQRPSKTSMAAALQFLFGNRDLAYQTYGSKGRTDDLKPHWKWVSDSSDVLIRLAKLNEKGMNIGVVPNVLDGKGRGKGNVKRIRWLFADFDGGGSLAQRPAEASGEANLRGRDLAWKVSFLLARGRLLS